MIKDKEILHYKFSISTSQCQIQKLGSVLHMKHNTKKEKARGRGNRNSPLKKTSVDLEALPVDNRWTRLVVFTLGNPHLFQHKGSMLLKFRHTRNVNQTLWLHFFSVQNATQLSYFPLSLVGFWLLYLAYLFPFPWNPKQLPQKNRGFLFESPINF